MDGRAKTEGGEVEIVPHLIHDLRNPIGVMLSFAEIIPTTDGAERTEFCARLYANAQRALHVLDDYALLWDLTAGRIEPAVAECEWPLLVRAAVEEARADLAGPARRLACHGERPAIVRADGARLRQALRSLVRDVLRGVGTDGAVRVEIRPSGDAALLDVAVDIDSDVPSRGRLLDDDSLGASLARAVAGLHGGSFAVRDGAQGLVASLHLPHARV